MTSEEKLLHKITHSIIASQIALTKLEDLKHTRFYKKELKMRLNMAIKELMKAESEDYDSFWNALLKETQEVTKIYETYINAISSIPIWDASEMTAVIEAFLLDRKSISGIAKKVLKQNGVEINIKK